MTLQMENICNKGNPKYTNNRKGYSLLTNNGIFTENTQYSINKLAESAKVNAMKKHKL